MNKSLLKIALLIGIIGFSFTSFAQKNKRPNVLIIQPDQHRGSVMGIAGNPDIQTPNLDLLAHKGIRFENAISGQPVCSPFRATLLSGMYIHKHGVVGNNRLLKPDLTTLGNIFEDAGYATGYVGKWHLDGGIPEEKVGGYIEEGERRQGWQEFLGYEKSHEFFEVWKYDENKNKVRVKGYNWEPTWHTDVATDFIKRKTEEGKPWAYYIAYGPPHLPEQCPQEFLDLYDTESLSLPPDVLKNLSASEQLILRKKLQVYYAQISAIDHEVGRLMKNLKDLGVDKNTIVIYTSDHGDVLGSHYHDIMEQYKALNKEKKATLRTKGKPYIGAMEVPLLISWPSAIKPNQVCEALVKTVDITATILDLTNLKMPSTYQGTSMASWCLKGSGPEQKSIYIGLGKGPKAWRGVYDGRYIYSTLGWPVLYDLKEDPYEMNNLYYSKENESVKDKLQKMTIDLAVKFEDPAVKALKKNKAVSPLSPASGDSKSHKSISKNK